LIHFYKRYLNNIIMGPKRKPGPKSRKRKTSSSSSEDSTDNICAKIESELTKVEEDLEEFADDPLPLYTQPVAAQTPTLAIEGQPGHEYHVCRMSSISQLKDCSASKRCVQGAPLKVKLADIADHYYHHYRDRNYWDKFVSPITEEDRRNKKWESFQCKLCDTKFKVIYGTNPPDPDSRRYSFCYHFAFYHGKLIDAMQEDKEIDMEPVLEILKKYHSAFRKFIEEGTDEKYSDKPGNKPCIARESCEWKMRYGSNSKQIGGGGQVPPSISIANNPVRFFNANIHRVSSWACPFNDRPDCKNAAHEKTATSLKIHLYNHYFDFWSDIVPEMTSKKVKCQDCGKPVSGETFDSCRNAMVCHRAIIHNELKQAIEEGIRDFDEDLFGRLFNQEAVKPPQVDPKRPQVQPPNQANQERDVVAARTNGSKTGPKSNSGAQVPNQPAEDSPKKVAAGWFEADSDTEDEEDPIPVKPYVNARIKQNLADINFSDHDDSDVDEEFKVSKKAKMEVKVAPRTLPKRNRRALKSASDSPESLQDSE